MGHYDDHYAREAEIARKNERIMLSQALKDLMEFRGAYLGRKWSLSSIGCEELFDQMLDKVRSRLYEG